MINKIFLIVSLVCLLFYLYGILTSIVEVEENDCKMTYMFEYPQFIVSKFHFVSSCPASISFNVVYISIDGFTRSNLTAQS